MLTGNPPESAPDRILSDTLADPVQLLPDLPPGVNRGIMRALRVKASDRPQSIEELKKILSESPQPDPVVNIKNTEEKSDRRENLVEKNNPAIPLWRREERIYTAVAKELETGRVDKGLWTRLFAECSGDERQIKVFYIKQRAERLITAELNSAENAEAERIASYKAASEKVKAERISAEKAKATDPAYCPSCQKHDAYRDVNNGIFCPNCKQWQLTYFITAELNAAEKAEAEHIAADKAASEKTKAADLAYCPSCQKHDAYRDANNGIFCPNCKQWQLTY
jgi:ribosomal protein L37AE/L43A